jgi:hypothetical protein
MSCACNRKLRYSSKTANEKHANLMLSLSEKITWGVLAIPITFLVKSDMGKVVQLDWGIPYIWVGGVMALLAIYFQIEGLSIQDGIEKQRANENKTV